ncbi:ISSoc3, orfA transposase, interruption-N [Synechococcus sp. JA-3-3Ab]|nr:ISSoc3, orfA transposase, interruption-N [Synechococcus sp. JA-3-3Ab]
MVVAGQDPVLVGDNHETVLAFSATSYNIGHRSVYSLQIHLVLVTKYRRRVIQPFNLK